MSAYSYSRIETFKNCPLQYKYCYIDGIKSESSVEAFMGSCVHEALEKLYQDRRHEKLMTLDELLAFYNRRWEEKWRDTFIIVRKDYTQENYRKMGERQITNYYKRYKPFDGGIIMGLETQDILDLDEEGEYKYHIRIDRLMYMGDGLYEVHDYKTGSRLATQEEIDSDEQLAMYSLWVRRRFVDCKEVRLVWHYTAFDKELESFRTEVQLAELRAGIVKKIKEIEAAEDFPGSVSTLCDWCGYKAEVCAMWRHGNELALKEENEYLNDPGLKLVDEFVKVKRDLGEYNKAAKQKIDKLKDALIDFCRREEVRVVFGSEKKVALKEQESIKLPSKGTPERDELVVILKSIHKYDDVSDLDLHALKKIIENKAWAEEDLTAVKEFAEIEKSFQLSVGNK